MLVVLQFNSVVVCVIAAVGDDILDVTNALALAVQPFVPVTTTV